MQVEAYSDCCLSSTALRSLCELTHLQHLHISVEDRAHAELHHLSGLVNLQSCRLWAKTDEDLGHQRSACWIRQPSSPSHSSQTSACPSTTTLALKATCTWLRPYNYWAA